MTEPLVTLQEKVSWLFTNYHTPEGKEYSFREVGEELEKRGYKVSHQALWKLRTGQIKKPSMDLLNALSKFFRVPLTYFSADAIPAQEQERLKRNWISGNTARSDVALRMAQDPEAEQITRQISQMSPQNKQIVLAVIKQIASMEGLDEDSTDVALE